MIKYKHGDILEAREDALVNPVNCVGAMGAGLAKQFKDEYPQMYEAYKNYCDEGKLEPGRVLVWDLPDGPPHHIFNLATKKHWRSSSRYSYIEEGLEMLADIARHLELKSIALPLVGAGLGALSARRVDEMIVDRFARSPLEVVIYLYNPELPLV